MAIIRLIYLAVIIITGAFVILYIDSLSLLLFIVTLALPIIMFLLLLIARLCTRITVAPPEALATRGQPISLKIHIKNSSFIALPYLRTTVTYKGAFSNEVEKTEISFPLHAFANQTSFFDVTSEHIGVTKIHIDNIYMYDYFRLFRFKFKIKGDYEVTFLPDLTPISMDIRPNTLLGVESDVFSKSKKGDDPSEVFVIRDYVGGDKLNRIHWKLSSKQDTLMVKDYSLPINDNVVIILELASQRDENVLNDVDTVIETAFNISNFLCEAEIAHRICWYDIKTEQFFCEEIKATDDMFAALRLVLSCAIGKEPLSMDFWKKERAICSHVAYITALSDASVLGELSKISYATFYSVFSVGKELYVGDDVKGSMQFVTVKPDKVADALSGFTL